MKKKVLISALALTGAVAIVGSGFSAWYFDTAALTADGSVNTYVTDLADNIGTLTNDNAKDSIYVVLDQGGFTNKDIITKGITFVKNSNTPTDSALGDTVSALSATYSISADDVTKLVQAGKTSATFKAVFTISDAASPYVQFVSTYAGETGGTSAISGNVFTYTYTVNYTKETAIKKTFEFSTAESGVYSNAMLSYKAKPSTKDAYNKMKAALTGNILTVAYSLSID